MLKELDCTSSSNLSKVTYDTESQELRVTFVNGEEWIYHEVPMLEWMELEGADSKGSQFSRNIKNNYRAERALAS